MATVNETLRAFDDQLLRAWMRIDLREMYDGEEQLLPRIDRLYCEKPILKDRDDGLELTYPSKTLKIDDTLDTFSAGDAAAFNALILKIWNAVENVEP